jgi:glyoxylase-like metal-dependent hydrolase (beta-lactamase superfamily II)
VSETGTREAAGSVHVNTRTLGGIRIHTIQTGGIKLDGGAMFGVVPKPLWERRLPADALNRIQFGMRVMLVEHASGLVLVDTGAGSKENDKFHEIYGVENAGSGGLTLLEDGLKALGVQPADVSLVINTHLHFDHAGGNTVRSADGEIRPAFPNARYLVQRREFEFATNLNERTVASYYTHNYMPISDAGLFDFVAGEVEVLDGVTVIPTPGHVPGHQSVLVTSGGESALFLGDVAPTATHLPLPWIMGYDVEPLVTLESKRRILGRALEEQWLVVFEHDWRVEWGYLAHDGKKYGIQASPGARHR